MKENNKILINNKSIYLNYHKLWISHKLQK